MQASACRNLDNKHLAKNCLQSAVNPDGGRCELRHGEWIALIGGRLVLFIIFICASLSRSCLSLAHSQPVRQVQWNETLTAASKEGKVVVFGPAGELIRNTLGAAFRKSFPGIVFEYSGGRATEQATRIQAERDGGVFSVDVFIGGAVTMMRLGSSGVLESLGAALILPQVKGAQVLARRPAGWCR
jgi:hypothetical protein